MLINLQTGQLELSVLPVVWEKSVSSDCFSLQLIVKKTRYVSTHLLTFSLSELDVLAPNVGLIIETATLKKCIN